MKYLFFALLLFPFNEAFAQKTKFKRVTFGKTKNVKEEYHVLKKDKKIKQGEYTSYHFNGNVKETGQYLNDQKDGKWLVYHKDGSLSEVQHYQLGQKLEIEEQPLKENFIPKRFSKCYNRKIKPLVYVAIKYPPMAREEGVEGIVELSYSFGKNCNLEEIKVVKSVGYGCDEEAIEVIKRLVYLTKSKFPEKCEDISNYIPTAICFRLN
ncbi:MAG: energy transducer TonB [Chitinophagales bacterium]